MSSLATDTVWRERLSTIPTLVEDIRLPDVDASAGQVEQSSEWCEVQIDGEKRRMRFHDYDQIFEVPGLYELLFYDELKCCSPSVVVNLLKDVATDFGEDLEDLAVLDVGAGNGMVGDELNEIGVEEVIGVDCIPEARDATLRDRPDVYDEYLVTDLTDLPEPDEQTVRRRRPNCLTTVAALGFGDIPPAAFLKALDLIAAAGWMAFNIKESFLSEGDESGFSGLIRQLAREEYIQTQCYRRYPHRLSITGEPLYYVAMIARKLRPISGELLDEWSADSD